MRREALLVLLTTVGILGACNHPDRTAPPPPTDPALQNAATTGPDVTTQPDTTAAPPSAPTPPRAATPPG
jgi:hypothetical protein